MELRCVLPCLSLLAGCTSLESYPASRLGPGLPIAVGDDIVIRPAGSGPGAQPKSLRVTAIGSESISGQSAADGYAVLTYRWEDLESIERRVPDNTRTGILAVLVFLMLYAIIDVADHLQDEFSDDD